jgi:hypothetical protein
MPVEGYMGQGSEYMQVIGEEEGEGAKLAGGQKSSWKSTTMRAGLKGRGIVGLCNSRWKKNWGVFA